MHWWPQSLFGRLMLVLAGGMLVAQLLSAAFNFAERDRLLQTASGMQQVPVSYTHLTLPTIYSV